MTDKFSVVEVFASGLAGAALATIVNVAVSRWDRAQRIWGNWAALYAEVVKCGDNAGVFLTAKPHIQAPSYRLPTLVYENALPALLADAGINDAEARTLLDFYTQVQSFNRGLDLANAARGDTGLLYDEDQRNKMKADTIKRPDGGLFAPAHDLCDRKRQRPGFARAVFQGRP